MPQTRLEINADGQTGNAKIKSTPPCFIAVFVGFVEDNPTMSPIQYFENHVSYFVQNRRK